MTDPSLPTAAAAALAPGVSVSTEGLRIQFSRGGGPGGQNVNKLNTAVQAWIRLDQLTGMSPPALQRLRMLAGRRLTAADELYFRAQTHRTQRGNLAEVFARLRELIVQAQVQPKRRRKTRPSAASKQRRLESKHHRGQLKAQRRGKL
jgi:ribosome-associated protein